MDFFAPTAFVLRYSVSDKHVHSGPCHQTHASCELYVIGSGKSGILCETLDFFEAVTTTPRLEEPLAFFYHIRPSTSQIQC